MIRMGVSGFWYRPTWVVPDQRPLNGRYVETEKHKNRVYYFIITVLLA